MHYQMIVNDCLYTDYIEHPDLCLLCCFLNKHDLFVFFLLKIFVNTK